MCVLSIGLCGEAVRQVSRLKDKKSKTRSQKKKKVKGLLDKQAHRRSYPKEIIYEDGEIVAACIADRNFNVIGIPG